MMTKDEAIKEYGFSTASLKWIPKGGDLMKYVGQDVVFVDFRKLEDGTWTSECKPGHILAIGDFNAISMTYRVKYQVGKDPTIYYETIIPEGFSFDIAGAGIQNKMCRFIPESLHMACIEEEQFYQRLGELWDKKSSIPTLALQSLSSSKEKHKTLNYCKHIAVVGKTDEGQTLYFKLSGFKLKTVKGGLKELTLMDEQKRALIVTGSEDAKEYVWPGVGTLKLIDLEGE